MEMDRKLHATASRARNVRNFNSIYNNLSMRINFFSLLTITLLPRQGTSVNTRLNTIITRNYLSYY